MDRNNNPVYVSEEKELELSLKEAEAIAKDIIYYFNLESKTRTILPDIEKEGSIR